MTTVRSSASPLPREDGRGSLAAQVFACVPVTQPAFLKLLGLLEIESSREIPTACVTLGARSRLLINPDFVRERCLTDADLRMLVLHELHHVLLGHTRLHRVVTPAQNWAFDALINAQLCQLFPDPAETALFRRLYSARTFPEALLRPPPGWRTCSERWPLKGTAGEAHRALYSAHQVTEAELFALLEEAIGDGAADTSPLLGDHRAGRSSAAGGTGDDAEGEAAQDEEAVDPDFLRAVREIVARWPMVERRGGRDLGGECHRERIRPVSPRRVAIARIRRAMLPLLAQGAGGGPVHVAGTAPSEALLPLRSRADRRGRVAEQSGEAPLLWRGRLLAPAVTPAERVHVYLDTSGSMDAVLPLLYGAMVRLLPWLHPRLHLFSTTVADIDFQALRHGRVITTCGTDIACVTTHMLAHRVRRALLVTDGWVGRVPDSHRRPLRRCRVGVVLTAHGDGEFARALGWRTHTLPVLEG